MSNNVAAKPLYNESAERSVLACWLGGVEGLGDAPDPSLFFAQPHREIAEAVRDLKNEGSGINTLSVLERIQLRPKSSCTHQHISEITYAELSPVSYEGHLHILRQHKGRRMAADLADSITASVLEGVPIGEIVGHAKDRIDGIADHVGVNAAEAEVVTAARLLAAEVPEENPAEIFRDRFLCRRSAMLFISNTGQGKSTLVYQGAYSWAAGREAFGLRPARALTILVIQAENDQQDLSEMLQGARAGMISAGFSEEEAARAGDRVMFVNENGVVEAEFFRRLRAILRRLANEGRKADLVVIDPVLSYLGGDTNKAQDVTRWLRGGVQGILDEFDVAALLIAHTCKPSRAPNGQKRPAVDDWYAALGSVEWINYPRASMLLKPVAPGYFELRAGKRGSRLRWKDAQGAPSYVVRLAHAKDGGVYWRIPDDEEFEEAMCGAGKRKRTPTVEELVGLFHTTYEGRDGLASTMTSSEIKEEIRRKGWDKDSYAGVKDRAEALGLIKRIEGTSGNEKRYAISAIADRINRERAEREDEEKMQKNKKKALQQSNFKGLEVAA